MRDVVRTMTAAGMFLCLTFVETAPAAERRFYTLMLCDNADQSVGITGNLRHLGSEFLSGGRGLQNLIANSVKFAKPEDAVYVGPRTGRAGNQLDIIGDDEALTDANIVEAINAIPDLANEDAVIFCAYFAHGGTMPAMVNVVENGQTVSVDIRRRPEYFYGHFFQLSQTRENIYRVKLWNALKDKHAKLTVLISDSCFPAPTQFARPSAPAPSPEVPLNTALYYLLTNFNGDVNINSCTITEKAVYPLDGGMGGYFTRVFFNEVSQRKEANWLEVFQAVSQETDRQVDLDFQRGGPQQGQHPFAFGGFGNLKPR